MNRERIPGIKERASVAVSRPPDTQKRRDVTSVIVELHVFTVFVNRLNSAVDCFE